MSTQDGPVTQGQPPVMAMDVDRAVNVLAWMAEPRKPGQADELADAQDALRALVDRARQYVAGPSSGRLAALCQVLQEPVPERAEPVNVQTVVQAYLTERRLVVLTVEAAERLGVGGVR